MLPQYRQVVYTLTLSSSAHYILDLWKNNECFTYLLKSLFWLVWRYWVAIIPVLRWVRNISKIRDNNSYSVATLVCFTVFLFSKVKSRVSCHLTSWHLLTSWCWLMPSPSGGPGNMHFRKTKPKQWLSSWTR